MCNNWYNLKVGWIVSICMPAVPRRFDLNSYPSFKHYVHFTQWKKEQASRCCISYVCLHQSVIQLHNNHKVAKLVLFSTACSFQTNFWNWLTRETWGFFSLLSGASLLWSTYLAEFLSGLLQCFTPAELHQLRLLRGAGRVQEEGGGPGAHLAAAEGGQGQQGRGGRQQGAGRQGQGE